MEFIKCALNGLLPHWIPLLLCANFFCFSLGHSPLPPLAFTPSPSGGRQGWGPGMASGVGYAWLAPTLTLPQRGRERITLTPALSHKWEREYTQAMVRQVVGMHWVAPHPPPAGEGMLFPSPVYGRGSG
ncbi:hypothetical protein AS359_14035 [Comamonas kerstersii]|uniref:Uncharacterized protein n=1 Tax=Comamonas kerstersii TaxID=225992 RepID=A0A0W7Z1Z7_9BURK|nr:hypothetical protein AS359_14035 [Comamonas kerstersii]